MKIRALIAYIFIILKKALLRYITQIIIICIAIPILFLIAVSLRITYQDLTLESLTRRETIAQLAANLVKERFDSLKELGLSLATRQRFRELVRDQKWNEAIQVMETIPTDFPYIERVFITDVQGNLKSDYPSVAGVKNMNFSYRDWYKGVTNEWKPYISEIYQRSAQPAYNVIAVAIPITASKVNTKENSVVGILVLQIKLDTLLEWSNALKAGPQAFTYFSDKRGNIAAHPMYIGHEMVTNYADNSIVKEVLSKKEGIIQWIDPVDNIDKVSAYKVIPTYEWGVIVEQPASEVFVRRDRITTQLVGMYVLFLILSCILIQLLLKAFSKLETKQAIRQKDIRFTALIEQSSDVIAIIDEKANIVYTSPSTTRVLGYSVKEILKKNGFSLIHPDDMEITKNALMKLLVNPKKNISATYRLHHKNGSWRWVESIGTNLLHEPSVGGIVINYRDVTERVEAEKILQERSLDLERSNISLREAKLQLLDVLKDLKVEKASVEDQKNKMETLLKSIGDGVIAVDKSGKIILMNSVAEKMSGITFAQAEKEHFDEIFTFTKEESNKEETLQFIHKVLQKDIVQDIGHCRFIHNTDTPLYVSLIASPIKDTKNSIMGCIVVIHDVTQEHELEQAKDNFFSISAHQLRTPLGGMRWNIESLLSRHASEFSPEVLTILKSIHTNNVRLIAQIRDILQVLKIQQGHIHTNPIITDIGDTIQSEIDKMLLIGQKKHITIEVNIKQKLPDILIEQHHLKAVVHNLISNALKYTNEQGKITIEVHKKKSEIEIQVTDTGIGIPKKDQKNIFSKFFRAKNAALSDTEGSGLGLYIVKSYVEKWKGNVWFMSEEHKGTTFYFTIPLVRNLK